MTSPEGAGYNPEEKLISVESVDLHSVEEQSVQEKNKNPDKDKFELRVQDIKRIFTEMTIDISGEESVIFNEAEIDKILEDLGNIKSQAPKTIKTVVPDRFRKNVELLGVSPLDWKKAVLKKPQLLYQYPETINFNISEAAKLLEIDKETYLDAALRYPELFYRSPETISNNSEEAARLIGIKKTDFVKVALKRPSYFSYDPKSLQTNFVNASILFDNDLNKTREALETASDLLLYSTDRIFLHWLARQITEKNTQIAKNPKQLIEKYFESEAVETLDEAKRAETEEGLEKLLRIFVRFEEQSQDEKTGKTMSSQREQDGFSGTSNIEQTADLLGIDREMYKGATLRMPPLALMKPETIYGNFQTLKILFDGDEDRTRMAVLTAPHIVALSQERDFIHWLARQITGKNTKITKNPKQLIETYFESKEDETFDSTKRAEIEEGLKVLLDSIAYFEKESKEDRKKK